ncbi:MAG: hypothetical protein HW403_924 [Dehalococcoidia bacterium]|nr:hypothetical protein [Dehalococcoidia bacterium]
MTKARLIDGKDGESTPPLALYGALLAIVLLSLAMRLPFLSAPLSADEGGYAYVAYWWSRGEALYRTVWIDRPQGIFLIYALGMKLVGESTEAIRLFGALYSSVTCIFVYLVGARVLGRSIGALSSLFFVLMSAHPIVEGFIPNGELYMALPVTISAFLLFRGYGRERTFLWLMGAGVAAGAAFMMKQSGIVALFFALSYVLIQWKSSGGGDVRRLMKEIGAVMVGFAMVFGPALAHGLSLVSVDYLRFLTHYGWTGVSFWSDHPLRQLVVFLSRFIIVAPAWSFFFLGGWWAFVLGARNRYLYLWLFWSVAGMAIGGNWYVHYYIQIAPPLSILAAQGVLALLLRRRDSRSMAFATWAMAAMAVFFVANLGYYYLAPSADERLFKLQKEPRFLVQRDIVQYLHSNTPEDATIYLAYSGADITYLSHRLSAIKYLYLRALLHVPGAIEETLAIMADPSRRPDYIVADSSQLEIPLGPGDNRFLEALDEYYVREITYQVPKDTTVVEFYIYRSITSQTSHVVRDVEPAVKGGSQ